MYTRHDLLKSVGNTELTAAEITHLAEVALKDSQQKPIDVMIFRTGVPYHGGTPELYKIVFDQIDDEQSTLIFGHSIEGEVFVFMPTVPAEAATVVVYEPLPEQKQAGG